MAVITNLQNPPQYCITKAEIDLRAMAGINFLGTKPTNPQHGDVYMDHNTDQAYVWIGTNWALFSGNKEAPLSPPTREQLEKHPALKQAWEEFLVIKKLIGI
jgi:hypothetical protein